MNRNYKISFTVVLLIIVCQTSMMGQAFQRPDGPMKTWTPAQIANYLQSIDHPLRSGKSLAHNDRKYGFHAGNQIRTLFYNYGSIGRPNTEPSMEWPAFSGHGYAYEFGPIIGAEVVEADGDTVHFFSDGMLDGGDYDPFGGSQWWGWEPIPGYAAYGQDFIANSNDPASWGDEFPADNDGYLTWPGKYGDGVITADFESYFKMDDRFNKEFGYYPSPSDSALRGLGIEVQVRGYQYAASVAEDIIFFQYEVKNVGEKRLDKVVVGMIGDPHIGGAGDFSDDYAGFINNDGIDSYTGSQQSVSGMVYCWDKEGSGNDFNIPWSDLGWLGYKFLESPGIDNDGIDNDNDDPGDGSMTDESQTNGIDDDGDWDLLDETAAADTAEARNYWSIKMWNGIDDDGDGRIDDWGDLDGKSDDLNGNGIPDPGEPDFEYTDVDESDMIELTSFWAPVYGTEEAQDDNIMWNRMAPGTFASNADIAQEADNIFIFGSGYFPLDPGEVQKFSIAVLLGQGKPDLLNNALVADWIYNLNFNFTKPPEKPELIAVPGNGKVTLVWNDAAENSVDPVNGKDFEGYKIYRSLVKGEWGKEITNNQGIRVDYFPIAQFDYDDDYSGPHPISSAEGYHMDMGDNTGLVRSFVDSNLVNGLTYYYAVTAYDHGSISGNLPPLECSKNFGESNVAAVKPNAPAAGYQDAAVTVTHFEGLGNGTVTAQLLDFGALSESIRYEVEIYINPSTSRKNIRVLKIDQSTLPADTTTVWENLTFTELSNVWNNTLPIGPYNTGILDLNYSRLDSTGWENSAPSFGHKIGLSSFAGILYPRDMVIEFHDDYADTSIMISPQPVRFKIMNVDDDKQLDILYRDLDSNNELSVGDIITPIVYVNNTPTATWDITIDTSLAFTQPPEGSRLRIYIAKTFCSLGTKDRFSLDYTSPGIDGGLVKDQMDRIAVVPNPYIVASGFEVAPPTVFSMGRGDRRVDFIHLPQKCTIRIYTMAGDFIVKLEHNSTIFDGSESWDLLNEDDHDIAPGIYLYHVETPDGGEQHIGRLAVIK